MPWSPNTLLERRRENRRPCDAPLVWAAVAAATGFAGQHMLGAGFASAVGLGLVAVAGFALWAFLWRRQHDEAACHALLATIATVAAAWGALCWSVFKTDDLARFATREASPACLEGIALHAPEQTPQDEPSPFRAIPSSDRAVLRVEVTRLRDGQAWRGASGVCEVVVQGRQEGVHPGDRLTLFGQLSLPEPRMNVGGYDAATRARGERTLSSLWCESPACLSVDENDDAWWLRRWQDHARRAALDTFDHRIGADQAPVAHAMILGDRSGLARGEIEAFRHTGMLHVLVVSGLHVGIVALCLPFLARFGLLPMRWAQVGSLALVLVYVCLVGGRPPAVRAAVLVAAAVFGLLQGRRALGANALAAAALGVLAAAPGAWLGVGTQLSFLAAGALLAFGHVLGERRSVEKHPLDRLIEKTRSPWQRILAYWRSHALLVLGATIAVLAVTGPLVAAQFHLVAPSALPLSVPMMLVVTGAVMSGLVTLVVESVYGLLGWPALEYACQCVAWFCSVCLHAIQILLEAAASAPGASFYLAGPAGWAVGAWVVWLGCAGATLLYWPNRFGAIWRAGLLLVAVAFAPVLWRSAVPGGELRCSILSVGHGSATLIQTPDGAAFLCDAGALASPESTADEIARVLWSRGVSRLDGVFLSHADVDHYNALPGLLERFGVGGVWTSTQMFPGYLDPTDHSGPTELRRLLAKRGVPVHTVQLGDLLRLGDVRMRVLHPTDLGVGGSDNANSLVLGVEYAGKRLLLTGDLESPGLDFLLSQEPYDCDLLVAPHHGSIRSDPPGFAAWSSPEHVVISSGALTPETGTEYRHWGASVLNTHVCGMVEARVSTNGVFVQNYLTAETPTNPR